MAKLAEEHSNVMADHQQELRKKLLYEYSKQDKLEAKLKEMQQTLDRQENESISAQPVLLFTKMLLIGFVFVSGDD